MPKQAPSFADVMSQYDDSPYVDLLVIGEKGVGKTKLIETCPKPIYLYGFDAGGEITLLRDGKPPEWLIPDTRYQGNDALSFAHFKQDVAQRCAHGDFSQVGTVVVDSLTSVIDSCIDFVLRGAGKQPIDTSDTPAEPMAPRDWGTFMSELNFVVKKLQAAPCHFVALGHIRKHTNEITNAQSFGLQCPGQMASKIPTMFSEVYYMLAEGVDGKKNPKDAIGADIKRCLITQNFGKYEAGSRLASNCDDIHLREEPDIKAILKKAGMCYDDLPLIGG